MYIEIYKLISNLYIVGKLVQYAKPYSNLYITDFHLQYQDTILIQVFLIHCSQMLHARALGVVTS